MRHLRGPCADLGIHPAIEVGKDAYKQSILCGNRKYTNCVRLQIGIIASTCFAEQTIESS